MLRNGFVDTIDNGYYTVWFPDTKTRSKKIKKLNHVETLSINDNVIVGYYSSTDGVIIGKVS